MRNLVETHTKMGKIGQNGCNVMRGFECLQMRDKKVEEIVAFNELAVCDHGGSEGRRMEEEEGGDRWAQRWKVKEREGRGD